MKFGFPDRVDEVGNQFVHINNLNFGHLDILHRSAFRLSRYNLPYKHFLYQNCSRYTCLCTILRLICYYTNWIVSSSDILLGGLYIKIKSCYVWPWRLWLWLPQAYISHIHIHIPPHIHFATNTINLPSCRLLCCCSRRENKRVEDGRFAGDQIFIDFVLPDLFAHQQSYGQYSNVKSVSKSVCTSRWLVDYLRTSGGGIFHWEQPETVPFLK